MARLTVRLLGPMEVTLSDGSPLPPTRTRKGLWLLALLALRAGKILEREGLATLLWPDTDESTARANLRRALTDLRQVLGADESVLLAPTPGTLLLDTNACDIDVLRFDTDPEGEWALYRGELLAGCQEEWVFAERRARAESYLKARLTLARTAPPGEAMGHLEAVIAQDPLRESAARALMEALASDGRLQEALGVYRKLRENLLAQRLAPEPSTTTLFHALRQRFAVPSTAPIPTALPVSLPTPLTSFVGRQAEREALIEQLERGARLITLLGPGGAGKTRLALEAAHALEMAQKPVRGFVDCSAITDARDLPQALTRVLDLRVFKGEQHLRKLEDALQDGVLFLDNLEQLEESPEPFLSLLLQRCPNLKLVTTSRVRLRIPGEVVLRLAGLPDPEATELFVQRAIAAGAPRSALDHATVESLCATLDGLPLALELAATWCGVLSPQEIRTRLHARFGLLKERNAQRGLEATLAWSWDRLPARQQEWLHALALLPGSWSQAPGAALVDRWGDELGALEAFQALADTSWLVVLPGQPSRYRLLESVRAFVQARTPEAQRRSALERLQNFWESELRDQPEIDDTGYRLEVIHRDLEALRVVLDDGPAHPERALYLLYRASVYFDFRGLAAECLQRISALLACLPPGTPRHSRWLLTYASNALWLGEYALAQTALEEALDFECEGGPGRAYVLGVLGVCLRNLGEVERAEACHREALALHQSTVQQAVESMRLGIILRERGAVHEAREAFENACALGDTISQAGVRAEWARLEALAGDTARAAALYRESIILHHKLGNHIEIEKLEKEQASL
jgi:DNA-binding SARP family transcriptional activator/predicted ATPase